LALFPVHLNAHHAGSIRVSLIITVSARAIRPWPTLFAGRPASTLHPTPWTKGRSPNSNRPAAASP